MKWFVPLLLMMVTATAHIDTLMPENCDNPMVSGFLSEEAKASCQDIVSTGWADTEKKLLVLALLYPSIGYIDADFLHGWNTAWEYDDAPEGVVPYNGPEYGGKNVIQNAWMKIISITPAVKDMQSAKVLAPSHGEVQTEYNYTLQDGIWNNGGSSSPSCTRKEYWIDSSSDQMAVTLDGGEVFGGTGTAATVTKDPRPYSAGSEQMDFNAQLDIDVTLMEKYWYCVPDPCCYTYEVCTEDGCTTVCVGDPCCSCGVNVNTIPTHQTITDSRSAEAYDYGFHVFQMMESPTKGIAHVFSLAPLNEFTIRLGSAYYTKSEWSYGLEYEYSPYNALAGTATKTKQTEEFDGMVVDREVNEDAKETLERFMTEYGEELVDPKGTGRKLLSLASDYPIYHTKLKFIADPNMMVGETCEMYISSHFERLKISGFCNASTLPETMLKIETAKNSYEQGEKIVATVTLESEGQPFAGNVEIEFQGERQNVWTEGATTITIPASQSGVITAKYETDLAHTSASAMKEVIIQHGWAWDQATDLLIILGVWFLMFVALKAVIGKVKP